MERVVPRFCTSFPQLHFSANAIGVERFQSNPYLGNVSALGRKLAETIKKNRADMSPELVKNMTKRCHEHVLDARRRYALLQRKHWKANHPLGFLAPTNASKLLSKRQAE
mgnify:CR=1 FL=1